MILERSYADFPEAESLQSSLSLYSTAALAGHLLKSLSSFSRASSSAWAANSSQMRIHAQPFSKAELSLSPQHHSPTALDYHWLPHVLALYVSVDCRPLGGMAGHCLPRLNVSESRRISPQLPGKSCISAVVCHTFSVLTCTSDNPTSRTPENSFSAAH